MIHTYMYTERQVFPLDLFKIIQVNILSLDPK